MKWIFPMSLVLLCLSACTPEPQTAEKKQKTWIDVYARFLESDQKYKIEASFLSGDTLAVAQPMKLEGNIKINELALEYKEFSESTSRYQLDFKDSFLSELVLNFGESGLQPDKLNLNIKPVPSFRVSNERLSKSSGGTIELSEYFQLGKSESLLLLISDENKMTSNFYVRPGFSGQSISLPPSTISDLKNGEGYLYFVCKKKEERKDINTYIYSNLEFYSKVVKVEIVE